MPKGAGQLPSGYNVDVASPTGPESWIGHQRRERGAEHDVTRASVMS